MPSSFERFLRQDDVWNVNSFIIPRDVIIDKNTVLQFFCTCFMRKCGLSLLQLCWLCWQQQVIQKRKQKKPLVKMQPFNEPGQPDPKYAKNFTLFHVNEANYTGIADMVC